MTELNHLHGTITGSGAVVSGSATLVGGSFNDTSNLPNVKDANDSTYGGFGSGVTSSPAGALVERRFHSDLGTAYAVSSVSVLALSSGLHREATRVEYSSDGASWTTATGSWSGSGGSPRVFTLTSPVTRRYWRVTFQDNVSAGLKYWTDLLMYTWDINGTSAIAANFSGTPLSGRAPLTVAFTDLSDGTPVSWAWTFGDGGTSTLQNPSHIYATPGVYTVTLTATDGGGDSDVETKVAYVTVTITPQAWDVYAAEDPNGPIIATLTNATSRRITVQLNGAGSGQFTINRNSPEATINVLRKGNLVKVRIPELSTEYIFAFWLETGDFTLLSTDEEGGEELTFGGRGALAYLDRAIMWNEAFTTGQDISDTWTKIWETDTVPAPVGSWWDGDPDGLWVIGQYTRKVYHVRQSDGAVIGDTGALFSGYAGGLSGDPGDATIYWALEAPWLSGSGSTTKIHKVRKSDHQVIATYDVGSAHYAGIRSDGTYLWLPNQGTDQIDKRSAADGSLVSSVSITYNGDPQTTPTGVSVQGTEIGYWFFNQPRVLIADLSAPSVITRVINTVDLQAYGGDWTSESGNEYLYPVSIALNRVWKYQLTAATPHDPVDGIWRLDEGTPGAILERLIEEWQAAGRPQQPIPDLTRAFDFSLDSDGNAWATNDGTLEFTAQIGESGLDVALRLIQYGVTLQMSPNLDLGAYNSFGTNRANGSFASGKVRFVAGVNIAEGLRRQIVSAPVASHMLAQGDGGIYATASDDDLGYTREGFISTKLTDSAALAGTAAAELARERNRAESLELVPDGWESAPLSGKYLPWLHYWVGDTVRLHTGSGELDYNEDDFRIYEISLDELENGEWRPVIGLTEGVPLVPGSGSTSGGSGGSSGGIGGAPSSSADTAVNVIDSLTDAAVVASTIQSDDWSVAEVEAGRAQVRIRWPDLERLANADIVAPADGERIAYDATEDRWVNVAPGAGMTLDDLDDVVGGTPALYDRLRYDGSVWRPSSRIWRPLLASDGTIVVASDGQAIMSEGPA